MAKNKTGKETMLNKIMKAPMRALIKVKDLYIQSMTECSGHFDYASVMGCPVAQVTTLPKSFSVGSTRSSNSTTDNLRELVKVSSTKSLSSNKIDLDFVKKQHQPSLVTATPNKFPRSRSVGIGRIDEDKPCEFEEDVKVRIHVYPRSRSLAVHKRTMFWGQLI